MEEDYILENEVEDADIEEGSPEGFNPSGSPSEDTISDEQIINAIKEIIKNDENDIERSDLSSESLRSESPLEVTPSVTPFPTPIDYSDVLTDIQSELVNINTTLDSMQEDYNSTIFDKSLNEYNILDSLIVLIVVMFFIKGVIYFIKHFTPKIWR